MQHTGNRNFGVPLPFSTRNPYGISARAALRGEVSIPEGPLEDVEQALVKPWLVALSRWLLGRGYSIYFLRQLTPIRKYKPSALPFYVERALRLPLSEFDKAHPPPSLEQVLGVVQSRPTPHDYQYDLINFLSEHLDAKEFTRLCRKYPCLEMGS